MADKMMRIAGRDPAGLAQNISLDKNGGLIVSSDSYRQRLERVVNLVGLDNFAMFMTFQESSEPYYDLFNKTLGVKADVGSRFYTVNGGPFGHYTSWRDKPQGSPVRLISSNSFEGGSTDPVFAKKYAVYLPKQEDFVGSCCIRIKGVGSGRKQFKVTLYSDNAGTPGTLLAQYNKVFLNGSRNDPVYDTNTAALTSNYYWVPMSLITGFGLSGYKAKWLVLEYADETGIDATNHVLWRYGANAGGKMAYHNGSDWVVTDDYSFEYMLYPEDIQLPEDFTICTLFKNSKLNNGDQSIIRLQGQSYNAVTVQNSFNVLNVSWVDEVGFSNVHNYRPHFPLTEQWSVIAVTFNRYRTSRNGKVQMYLNGRMLDGYQEDLNSDGTRVREGINGRGGAKLLRYGSLALCHTIYPNGTAASTSNTDIGPFFIAKRALAPDEIASVSSLMLGDYSKLEE